MDYKTRIKVAAVIGVVIFVVIFIFMIIFVRNNQTSTNSSNTSEATTSIEIDMSDAIDIAVKDGSLVKLNSDLEEVTIMDDFDYDYYTYYDNKIYLADSEDGKNQVISSLDLETNEKTEILTTKNLIKSSFDIYNGNIYYVTKNNSILEYNIENEKETQIVTVDDNQSIENCTIDKDNGIIYYMENILENENYTMVIYKFDLTDDSSEAVLSAGAKGDKISIYENYINFSLEINDGYTNYIFNLNDDSFWEVGNSESNGYVQFSEKYIIFSDGENIKLTDYEGNVKNTSLYSDENGIYDIAMLTENIVQIRIGETSDDLEIKTINFETSKIKDSSKNYSNILNLW